MVTRTELQQQVEGELRIQGYGRRGVAPLSTRGMAWAIANVLWDGIGDLQRQVRLLRGGLELAANDVERLRATVQRVRELAQVDLKCPCCSGYEDILATLAGDDGGDQS